MHELKLNRCAVIGNPVNHSMSPYIHASFARQFDIELSYEKIQAEPSNFEKTVMQFFADGGRGMNVTVPFKSKAAKLVDQCSVVAKTSDSVNTIYKDASTGLLVGDSTDGHGWTADIQRLAISLNNKNILLIGAGGAARIIINQLQSASCGIIHVCNRTEERAQQLANKQVTASGLQDIPGIQWDLIINTLSVGWQGSYPEINIKISPQTKAYDLNYGSGAEAFKQFFIGRGGQGSFFYDGWGMLVEQAAASFFIWWGKRPSTAALIANGPPTSPTKD